MKVFLKYVLRSMLEKKARLFLLLVAIILSTALFVGSMGAVDAALDSFVKPRLEQLENKEIFISAKDGEGTFSLDDMKLEGVKDIIPEINSSAIYDSDDMQVVSIHARTEEYINKKLLLEEHTLKDFEGGKCIISKRISDKFNLKIGQDIKIILNGERITLEISAISANEGIFYADTKDRFQVIVPYEYIANKYNLKDKYNSIMASKTEESVKDSVEKFNDANTKFAATELYNEEAIKSQVSQITTMFYMMLTIVVFMSGIIIYSSFKLTVTERLPIIGTFLSQGATRGIIRRILYLESLCYGFIGGIIGNALGIGLLYLINYAVSPLKEYGIMEKPNININYLIFGLVFSVVLSLVSAVVPIIRTNKLQVKEVILNTSNNSEVIGIRKFIIGILLLVAVLIINSFKNQFAINLSPLLIILAVSAIMFIFPKIIDFVSKNIFSSLRDISSINALSLNNMRTSKVLLGNVNLLIVSIIAIVMINSLGVSIKNVVTEAYENLNYDLYIDVPVSDTQDIKEKIINVLENEPAVIKDSIQKECYANGSINNSNYIVMGIDPDKYRSYDNYIDWDKEEYIKIFEEFKSGDLNGVILSKKIAEKLKLKVGDNFDMKLRATTENYKVVGVVDGKLMNNGVFLLINFQGLPKEYRERAPISLILNTSADAAKVKENINKSIRELGGTVSTYEETRDKNIEANKMLINILSIFSFMAVVIGSFGVLNNIGISFIQRKKDLAVLSSVGMSNIQRGKMIINESILTVVWSTIIVIPFSYLVISILSKITKLIGFDMDVSFNINFVPITFIVSLILVLIATIPVLFKSKKLSIIEELKYE